MGSFFSDMWNKLFSKLDTTKRILMVGLDSAGKTTILYKLKLGEPVTTIPTIGFNVETVSIRGVEFTYENCNFNILQEFGTLVVEKVCKIVTHVTMFFRGKYFWRHYFENTQALIVVVDSNDRERMPVIADDIAWMMGDENLKIACLLVFANKQDLKGAAKVDEVEQVLRLKSYKDLNYAVMPSVAPSGEGLLEGFDYLASVLNK